MLSRFPFTKDVGTELIDALAGFIGTVTSA